MFYESSMVLRNALAIRCSLLSLALLSIGGAARAADEWSQLRLAMTGKEVVAVLGQPLLRSSGHGFDRWVYDNGAEVLLHGTLIGWTIPGTSAVAERSVDIWKLRDANSRASAASLSSNTYRGQPTRPAAVVRGQGDAATVLLRVVGVSPQVRRGH